MDSLAEDKMNEKTFNKRELRNEREWLPLDNFIEAHYTIVQERKFYKKPVRLLRKK